MRTVLRDGIGEGQPWETVVPERRGVITGFAAQSDALYFTERDSGAVRVRKAHPSANAGAAMPVQPCRWLLHPHCSSRRMKDWAWHLAAVREKKQHSIDDMIAAIEALIARRYTSAGRVAISGTSFGANIPGLVMLQRPKLLGRPIARRGKFLDAHAR